MSDGRKLAVKKLNKTPLSEQAYQAMRGLILSGRVRLGQAVSEVELAAELGVSRTPVREAFRRLIAEGLLVSNPSGTVNVFAPSIEDVAEVYATRAVLEGLCARLLVLANRPDIGRNLESHALACSQAGARGDIAVAVKHNNAFHRTIVEASHNSRIRDLIEILSPLVFQYSKVSVNFTNQIVLSSNEHFKILEALRAGDPDGAEAAARDHVLRAGTRTVEAIEALDGIQLNAENPLSNLLAPYREQNG